MPESFILLLTIPNYTQMQAVMFNFYTFIRIKIIITYVLRQSSFLTHAVHPFVDTTVA